MLVSSLAPLLLSVALSSATPTSWPTEWPTTCKSGLSDAGRVEEAFKSSGVIPTVIPSIDPMVNVEVNYNGKQVNLGNTFVESETEKAPAYHFTNEAGYDPECTKYSFFLIDPDVPGPQSPNRTALLQWYVAHNSPSCVSNSDAKTIESYISLTPLSSQPHLYTFLVYREPPGYEPHTIPTKERLGFDVVSYAEKTGLVLVGGNFLREGKTSG